LLRFARNDSEGTSLRGAQRPSNPLPTRLVLLRQLLQRGLVGAVAQPFALMMHPEAVIKLACRVPVEHMKIDAAPAALDRDRGEPRHQALADAFVARRLGDIEVFEVEAGPAKPRREARMEQRAPRGLAVEKSENGLE